MGCAVRFGKGVSRNNGGWGGDSEIATQGMNLRGKSWLIRIALFNAGVSGFEERALSSEHRANVIVAPEIPKRGCLYGGGLRSAFRERGFPKQRGVGWRFGNRHPGDESLEVNHG